MSAPGKRAIPLILARKSRRIQENSTNFVEVPKKQDSIVSSKNHDDGQKGFKRLKKEKIILEANDLKVESANAERHSYLKQETPTLESSKNIKQLYADPHGFLEVEDYELDLERTLLGGQSFRWTKWEQDDQPSKVFSGVVGDMAVALWRCDSTKLGFKILSSEKEKTENQVREFFQDYFQLNYKLKDLYEDWSTRDNNLKKCCEDYMGFRMLRQDPIENVFSFICATNNNIKRISQMVENMCKNFGEKIGNEGSFYKFPTIERLAQDDVEDCLRNKLSFGYRAKYIRGAAKKLIDLSHESPGIKSPSDILYSLRQLSYPDTCKQLMQLPGIGRKVADCICLMSMDHLNAVPTDCHIYEIVCRDYIPSLRQRKGNLNEQVHNQIGDYFNNLHGPLAGWSTSVLFISELKHLKKKNSKIGNIKTE